MLQTRPPSSVSQSACTHTSRMCVRTQITWTWLCTRGKKRYKYCSFSHTNHSFRVLGHQCVVTMGNCLIWIYLCMFFFPLIETVTYTCHYMTDRLERFDLKTSKLDLLTGEQRPLFLRFDGRGVTAWMDLALAAQKGMIAGWPWMLVKPIFCVFFSYTGILSLFIRYNDLFAGKTDTPFFCFGGD